MNLLALLVVFLSSALGASNGSPAPAERATPRAHSHNDYQHPHPLFDALRHGFTGVEADVFLVGDALRVAHDRQQDWSKVPTLDTAYLTPLAELVRRRGGSVYGDGAPLMLLVDLKSEPASTYRRVHEVLTGYAVANPKLFTTYTRQPDGLFKVEKGAISVVISGVNRPREVMAAQGVRYAGCDGRLVDVGPDVKPEDTAGVLPLVSDNWNNIFTIDAKWDGKSDPPDATRARLRQLVEAVHGEGKQLRLWNLPVDGPRVWGLLWEEGVDWINTDDLEGLARFVRERSRRNDQ